MIGYKRLKDQMQKLSKQVEAAKERELGKAIAQVRELIDTYELTAEQLGLATAAPAPAEKRPKAPPKYRDPVSGKEWNGIGKRPGWIVAAGSNSDKFLIANSTAAAQTKAETPAATAAAKSAPAAKKKAPAKKAAKAKTAQASGKATAKKKPAAKKAATKKAAAK